MRKKNDGWATRERQRDLRCSWSGREALSNQGGPGQANAGAGGERREGARDETRMSTACQHGAASGRMR